MTTSLVYIDYDAILQRLKVDFESRYKHLQQRCDFAPAQALRELRTVGIATPRQCGKTTWMMGKLREDPHSVAVVMNLMVRDHLRSNYTDIDPERILTLVDAAQLHQKMLLGEVTHWVWPSSVYVDGNSHLLVHGRLKELYNWLALNPQWETTTVIRLS